MVLASYLLAALAALLAWPVPIGLAGARWPARSPFSAMILWQAIALAGGLSMIGAMLVYGLAPLGPNLLAGLSGLGGIVFAGASTQALGFWHIFALSTALVLSIHLVFTLLLTYLRIGRQRRRHRDLLVLLSSPDPAQPDTVVLNHPAPVAYCLPGGSRSVTVLSEGLLGLLTAEELRAVMLHEQSHLVQRHHLLLWAFSAWRAALPWLPTSRLAQQAVTGLSEMLADDAALAAVDRATLIRAVALVGSGSESPVKMPRVNPAAADSVAFDTAGSGTNMSGIPGYLRGAALPDDALADPELQTITTARRLGRLLSPQPVLSTAARCLVLAVSALLLAVPTILLVAPGLAVGR